jgi:hypothetical protein
MEVRILKPPGALTDASGMLVFPAEGDTVEVTAEQGEALCDAKLAETVEKTGASKPKSGTGRAKKPKRNTVGKGPDETR